MKIIVKSRNSKIEKGGEKRMKYSKVLIAFVVAGFILVTFITARAAEDVRNSKHNLVANTNIGASGTTEVCVFCHTPHGGTTTVAGGAAPLWNRNLSQATYIPYDSPNFDAAGDTPGIPKGVSVACLSCHDGTVGFDSLINFGGSGSVDTINFTGDYVDKDGDNSFKEGAPYEPFPNLGTNLSNDHPISMEIPPTDPQFTEIIANLDNGELGINHISPLRRGADSTLPADKRDRVRAYPTVLGKAYIECASCHNPHENTSTRFLRYPSFVGTTEEGQIGAGVLNADRNAGSLLCLTCHQK